MRPVFPVIPGQRGLATCRQLSTSGWTRAAIHTMSSTVGRQVLPRVYAADRRDLTDDEWLMAGWLWAGADGVLTGRWALQRQGIVLDRKPYEITYLVRATQRARSYGRVRALPTSQPPTARQIQGIPTASVERALLDLSRSSDLTVDHVRALTIAACQSGLTTAERVTSELGDGRHNKTNGVRLGLDDFLRGPWSMAEVMLERLLTNKRRSYQVLINPELFSPEGKRIGVPDGYLPKYGIAIQVHSRRFHSGVDAVGRDRWAATVEADGRYEEHGIAVVAVAPTTLRDDPDRFLRRVDAVVAARRPLPQPPVVVIPRALNQLAG